MSNKIDGLSEEMQAEFANLALPLQTFGRAMPVAQRETWIKQVLHVQQTVADIPQTHTPAEPVQKGAIQNDGDWRFIAQDSTIAISGYLGNDTNVTIPAKIQGTSVTVIQHSAFQNMGLTSVTFPDGLTSIEDSAFAKNKLTGVTFPKSLTSIGKRAFRGNHIAEVNFGGCAASVGDGAFEDNELTEVTTGDGVISIGDYVFRGNRLAGINLGRSVTSIGYGAFARQLLTSVTIPNSVTAIGDAAFEDNQLTKIELGSGVCTIGASAFENNNLPEVAIPKSVTAIGKRAFFGNKIISVAIPDGVTIEEDAFAENSGEAEGFKLVLTANARSLTITGGSSIIKDLHIPLRIQRMPVAAIADGAFEEKRLTGITIPETIVTIGKRAFANNQIAGALEIPNSVTSIGPGAFSGNKITKAVVPPDAAIGPGAFENNRGTSGDFDIALSGDAKSVCINGYNGSDTSVNIPGQLDGMPVSAIGHQAFADKGLTSVTFNKGIKSIGPGAFLRNLLTEVTIPDSVTEIGDCAFSDNPLRHAAIPSGIAAAFRDYCTEINIKTKG
ncbi:MAG: leucine-rich repeat domain-containing protein [Chitinispirillia bacterium]|nr:leucine-rich repeat domain-containing protein [Chitinispirillia bacterium]MCL2242296.1 leucine-rich repeat domain-containing protein [Chitinispirillia bacterium]